MTSPLPSSSTLQSKEMNVRKRQATESIHVSEDESFPHFLVVEATDSTPIKYSIFTIQKILQCAVGNVKSAKKLRSGAVLVEVNSKPMAKRAMSMTTWVDTAIKVSPHRSLNSSRGVIRCRDFRDCDDHEVMDALRSQGVIDVKHIQAKKDNVLQPTNTFILTFSSPSPPKLIKAAYMRISVELFVPNPLRCYQCQKFGHGKNSCQRPALCAQCGGRDHQESDCHADPHCVNCGGNHTCYSKDCPEWARQKEITKIKFERNVSFGEAKQIVDRQAVPGVTSTVRTGISYAKATVSARSRATQSVEIQTDFTWPLDCKFPILCSSVFQPLAGGHSKVSDVAASAAQTDLVDSVFVEAGGQPLPLLEMRTSKTGDKLRQPEQKL